MTAYVGRHRAPRPEPQPRIVPMPEWLIAIEAVGVAVRHMGATPDGLMGPWDDRRTEDESWALAEIDATDWRAAS